MATVLGLMGVGVGAAAPASAASTTPVLDSFVQPAGWTVANDGGLYIYIKKLKDVPAQAGIKVSVLYPKAARTSAPLDSWNISGAPGSETLIGTMPNYMGAFRIAFTINQPGLNEERDEVIFNAPPPFTTTTVVTDALVVANIVSQHLPGIGLMFFPEAKLVKAAGFFLEGWSLYGDLDAAFSNALVGCPALKTGQVIESTSTEKLSGEYLQVWVTTKIWTSQTNHDHGIAPVCTLTNKIAEYN